MGEEEFSLVMPDLDSAQAAADFAARLTESFIKTPVQLGDRDVFIHVLIGIALYPLDGLDAEILLNHAQLALSHAKDFGSMQYYSARMSDTALQGLTLEDVMQRAFECGEFVVHYVPKVCLSDGKVDGMEALLYWQSPERGMVAPREFVPQLEKMGLIVPVGAWLLETVCRQIAHWQQTRCAVSTVSINVSALELFQDDLAGLVLRALQRHGLMQHAGILEFELSEHLLMSDMVAVSGALKALKEIGVAICIEDFGTGHSCLNYLKYLPVDTLKIDQTFIRNLPHSREDAAIVSAIITLGLGLGLQVVAAGVETAGQLDWLRDAGCLVAQGSLIGPAVLPAPTGDEG
jgi:EAL domain-containing protein (putative c-di-GMP-specific phosphodiesterase class I)